MMQKGTVNKDSKNQESSGNGGCKRMQEEIQKEENSYGKNMKNREHQSLNVHHVHKKPAKKVVKKGTSGKAKQSLANN